MSIQLGASEIAIAIFAPPLEQVGTTSAFCTIFRDVRVLLKQQSERAGYLVAEYALHQVNSAAISFTF